MEILLVGLSHKTAPVEIREKVSFPGSDLRKGLGALLTCPEVGEGLILSTCNRVEVYAATSGKSVETAKEWIIRFLSGLPGVTPVALEPHLYCMSGDACVRHIFRVSSSLDSMVVGEPQILGQMKEAFGCAVEACATGNVLNRLLHKTFSVAKRVRSETGIASSAVSVSFAAVELARKIFETLEGRTVMLIGAGEMAELAARHLLTNGVSDLIVVNRTYERAVSLAAGFGGSAVPFEELENQIELADIVISSTGSAEVIVDRETARRIIRRRRHRPMFFVDIAVPRDIDPAVNNLENVYVYDIDDLEGVVRANIKERAREAEKAEEIVDGEVRSFMKWMQSRQSFPTIVALKQWAEEIRREEVERTLRKTGDLSEADRKRIEAMTEAIINKILHPPISRMKREDDPEDDSSVAKAVKKIFDLKE